MGRLKGKRELSPMEIEWINLKIFSHLLRRNLRYLLVAIPMYGRSFMDIYRSHHLRTAYCFARYIDDMLDGDYPNPPDTRPEEIICRMMEKIENCDLKEANDKTLLGKYVFDHIDDFTNGSVVPTSELKKLIHSMLFDRMRMDQKLLFPQKLLDDHLLRTFCSALHVTLCISGADYRTEQVIPLARAQASLYTLRDLREDLDLKINNIPKSILGKTGLNGDDLWRYELLVELNPIHAWIGSELKRGRHFLSAIHSILEEQPKTRFKVTVKPLVRGLTYLSKKLGEQFIFVNEEMEERLSYAN